MKSGNANGNNGNNQSGSGGGSDFSMTTLLIVSSLLFLACESGVMWGNYVLFYSEPDADTPAEVVFWFLFENWVERGRGVDAEVLYSWGYYLTSSGQTDKAKGEL